MIRLLTEEQLQQTVRRLALELRRDYEGRRPVLVGVLKGAFVFLADLSRELAIPHELDFIDISSYGTGRATSGEVRLVSDITSEIRGRDVVLVEDIVDSGLSLQFLRQHLESRSPASLSVCALLVREGLLGASPRVVDYAGETVAPGFVVGYGIDCAEDYRYLRDIWMLKGEEGNG